LLLVARLFTGIIIPQPRPDNPTHPYNAFAALGHDKFAVPDGIAGSSSAAGGLPLLPVSLASANRPDYIQPS
jgi:hypothetical protein